MDNSDQPHPTQPIPEIGFSEIFGLLEVLKTLGGRQDIYKLASELNMEFGETLAVIRAAELLTLVHTPGGDVVLEPLGEDITKAKISERKEMIRPQLLKLPVFREVITLLESEDEREIDREEVEDKLAELLPNENVETSFNNLVSWGRYAEVFAYNDDSQTLYLDDLEEESSD